MLAELTPATAENLKVAIIGGGLMGHALAAVMVAAKAGVSVFEANPDLRASLVDRMNTVLKECGNTSLRPSQVHNVSSLEDLDPAISLVIEAIPEDLRLKQELFARLEALLPEAVLATNSSVYRVRDVSALMQSPSRSVGTHWWNPPHLIPIVEVIPGPATQPGIVRWITAILKSAGKTPVLVRKDTAGFIGNRLQHALWREAIALVEEGVADAETVDLVARSTLGMKLGTLGPLENADYVGLDLTHAIHQYIFPTLSQAAVPSPLLADALAHQRLGAKSGQGLMDWPSGRREQVASRLGQYIRSQVASRDEPAPSATET